ncbi:HoxA-like transcriptional regulator [Halorubrum sp. JWXQ-INN 858]|uniref:winged helix-turn-helix transcriptional regulator n=1 Tax=Halorubrum sp. JWXQ-INN 858 TaxID=2690782 RepID=UPI00135C5F64|nr:helix-turn-helix domain-containing protein [Halorubrum sp. JWXQ-INN 858]MWV65637.1 HoxA-like transcriptional regulator [Halorubrum sp. JWXQ-INN 858]
MDTRAVLVPPDDRVALDVLALLSKKWEPAVLLVLFHRGPLRFSELESALPEISANMLTTSLRSLSDNDLITRQTISESPLQVEYRLTDAGKELQPTFSELSQWGESHLETPTRTAVIADRDDRLTRLYGEWLADDFEVLTVSTGDQLREKLVDTPDVVIVDTRFWEYSLEEFEAYCPSPTRRVLLVGRRPELSLAAWSCDSVLRKPIRKSELLTAVETQIKRMGQPKREREQQRIHSKLSVLEAIYPTSKLTSDNATAQLYERRAALSAGDS